VTLKTLLGVLTFVALTVEYNETFDHLRWHTVMVYGRLLFDFKIPGLGLGGWDLCLGAVVVALALRPSTWRNRVPVLDLALVTSLLAIVSWVVFGALRGGDLRQAQMQVNALVRMFILFFAFHAALRTSRDASRLAWVILGAAVYRAVGCMVFFYLFVWGGRLDPYPEALTDHHDSVLWATAILGLVSWVLASRRWGSLALGALLAPLLMLAIHYNDRRIAWVELAGGLALLYVVMSEGRLRSTIRRYAILVLPVLLLYVGVGWGRTGKIFSPVEHLRSALTDTTDPSNDARVLENRGLIVTLQNRKLFGTGFGHEFTEVSVLYSFGMQGYFPNYRYLPHNSLLGVLAFTGVVGFALIWSFIPASAFLAARAYRYSRDRREQALSLVAFAVPFVYSAQAFGDMGVQSLKASVILAASTAIGARLAVNTGAWPTKRRRRVAALGSAPASMISEDSAARSNAVWREPKDDVERVNNAKASLRLAR
jgi:hypothetical protein